MLESKIENKVVEYFKAIYKGGVCYKFKSPTTRGVPDRIFIYDGKVLFIEFKKKGKDPRVLQKKVIHDMCEAGALVYVVDNYEDGVELINDVFKKGTKL